MIGSKNMTVVRATAVRGIVAAELIGKVHGRLTILSTAGVNAIGHQLVTAACSCGSGERTYPLYRLRHGVTKSCGCFRREYSARERPPVPREVVLSRLLAKTRVVGDCLEWTGAKAPGGYGTWFVNGKAWRVPRLMLFLTTGEIPVHACHRCDNPPCVKPEHLFNGTPSDNMRDCVRKGRLRNMFGRRLVTAHGETRQLSEWCALLDLNYATTWRRIAQLGWTPELALAPPIKL